MQASAKGGKKKHKGGGGGDGKFYVSDVGREKGGKTLGKERRGEWCRGKQPVFSRSIWGGEGRNHHPLVPQRPEERRKKH